MDAISKVQAAVNNTSLGHKPVLGADFEFDPRLVQWNSTSAAWPNAKCLHLLIDAQCAQTPGAIALNFQGSELTYAQLATRSDQLAHFLREKSAGPDVLIGICMERSLEMVIGLVAILKAGSAYVPIDPEYPRDRLAYMLQDSGVGVLLTQEKLRATLPPHTAELVCLDTEVQRWPLHATAPLESKVSDANLAYMIYTSGSTGKPKGALNHHRGVVNRLLWMQDRYRLTPTDSVLQKTPFSFDVSVWEFFWPLITGARLVIARPGGHQDPAYLADLIRREKITVLHFVPSMLRTFLTEPTASQCTSLRHVICSGEALTADLQGTFFQKLGCELHNLYGPTEAAVDVTHWTCQRGSKSGVVPIGRPVANTQIHILDESLKPVPIGNEGELHIGGIQVGNGYHNRPELTAEKFIQDPFSSDPAARLYKTGDLARWTPEGVVEYLGRLDFQVKIRGFRIELGEIESALGLHQSVRQAVVVAIDEPGRDKRLVAYLTSITGSRATVTELRDYLLTRLPEYMVPALFVWLDTIPLSPNGKVDRRKLPAPSSARPDLAESYAAPTTETERSLVTLWQETLGIEPIGIDDRFFELGGDSLGLALLHTRLQSKLNREFPITTLFEFTTVRTLASYFEPKTAGTNTVDALQERARRQREAISARKNIRRTP